MFQNDNDDEMASSTIKTYNLSIIKYSLFYVDDEKEKEFIYLSRFFIIIINFNGYWMHEIKNRIILSSILHVLSSFLYIYILSTNYQNVLQRTWCDHFSKKVPDEN
jgi:hypothetical protein